MCLQKGLYVSFDFEYNSAILEKSISGIEKKIYYQIQTLKDYGYDMIFYNPYIKRNHSIEKFLRRMPFHYLKKWDFDYTIVEKLDFVYIRKMWFMDGDIILFLKKVKQLNPNIKICLEIPTYPYDKEGKKWDMIPLKIKDRKWRKYLKNFVDRIITYSNDDMIFGIQTIKISNAISFSDTQRTKNNVPDNVINMIACGNLYYWHGFDRAIEGLAEYYQSNYDKELNLYIVGDGAEYITYKQLIEKYHLQNHIFLIGSKYGKELDEIYDKCSVGLDSMGRHRSNVFFNSSLKGKEYCAKGLVIISGVETELDYDKDYPYYYRVEADNTPVDFEKFLKFYNRLIRKEEIEEIQNKIILYAKEKFDFKVAMNPVQKFIESE